jgi:hypothetical protein
LILRNADRLVRIFKGIFYDDPVLGFAQDDTYGRVFVGKPDKIGKETGTSLNNSITF